MTVDIDAPGESCKAIELEVDTSEEDLPKAGLMTLAHHLLWLPQQLEPAKVLPWHSDYSNYIDEYVLTDSLIIIPCSTSLLVAITCHNSHIVRNTVPEHNQGAPFHFLI